MPLNGWNTSGISGLRFAGTAYAAALPGAAAPFIAKLQEIHGKLLEDPADAADVRAARDKWVQVAGHPELIQNIWSKISSKKNEASDPAQYDMVTEAKIAEFISKFGIVYDSDLSKLEAIRTNADYRKLMNQLAQLGGVSGGLNEIGFNDIIDFYTAVENSFKGKLQSMNSDELLAIGLNRSKVSTLINESVEEVMSGTIGQSLTFAKILNGLGITAGDVISAKNSLGGYTDPQQKARDAFAIAYIKTQARFSYDVSGDGRTVTPKLTILEKLVPNSVLTWSIVSGESSKVTVDSNGNFILKSGNTTASIRVKVETKFIVKKILEHDVTLTANSGGGVTPTPTPTSPSTTAPTPTPTQPKIELPTIPPETITNLQGKISDLKKQFEQNTSGLSEDQKAHLAEKAAREARDLVAAEIRKLATVDLSGLVKEENGKKVLKFSEQDKQQFVELMKTIQEQAKMLNDMLASIDPSMKPAVVEMTLYIGEGDASELTIPKDMMSAAASYGIGRITGVFNGVGLSLDTSGGFTGDVSLSISKLDPSVASNATSFAIGSDVYDLEVRENGELITSFSKPLLLRMPVKNPNGFDQERLVAVKIVDGKPQVVGGMFDSSGGYVEVERNSLSTYVVIENKVTFDDVGSVAAWAGRAIEVTAAKGVFNGRSAGQFAPNENVTRAEFAKMLVVMFHLEDAKATHRFKDVNDSDWFTPYVAAAVKAGVVTGRSAETFDPNSPITRAEMATMTARALKSVKDFHDAKNIDQTLGAFRDADKIPKSLKAGAALMVKEELMQGVRSGVFDPNSYATRAQAAVLMYRVLNSK
ncbi:S-layer homology domain-containing protein [Paenibacillus thermotolerans]|uniref:S-layer homology domain-containing protein n=1 Tax=Paenibacillus thermotolerans TaxID=3027807 RepID=UPI002367A2DE|nr:MULTISPECIES: S-layer homology domain-containing protein [unclassified Paenibacillus]